MDAGTSRYVNNAARVSAVSPCVNGGEKLKYMMSHLSATFGKAHVLDKSKNVFQSSLSSDL